jgi:hypothetical protein
MLDKIMLMTTVESLHVSSLKEVNILLTTNLVHSCIDLFIVTVILQKPENKLFLNIILETIRKKTCCLYVTQNH